MTRFNRNVITQADITSLLQSDRTGPAPATLDEAPPAGATPPTGGATPPVPTADTFLTKLLKFVPLEVLGTYLFIAGILDSNVESPSGRSWALGVLLLVTLVVSVPYNVRVLGVARWEQAAMSVAGLTVYVMSIGGWFATTSWYEPYFGTIALAVFGLAVSVLQLRPLPTGQ